MKEYKSKIICIKTEEKIKKFMKAIKYKLVIKTINNSIYFNESREYLLQNIGFGSNLLNKPLQCKFQYFLTLFPRLFLTFIKETTLSYYYIGYFYKK